MKRTALLMLVTVLLSSGCALTRQPEIPVAVQCPPPPPAPAVLTTRSASTAISISERLESSIAERDNSLTKARR